MLQVELFDYPTLEALKKAQNLWFKDMSKIHGEAFKIIEFLSVAGLDGCAIFIYYMVS